MWWLIEGLAALLVAVGLNAAIAYLVLREHAVERFAAVGMIVGLGLGVCLYGRYQLGVETIASLLLYALGCELYVFLFTLVLASITANLVWTLAREPLNDRQVSELYDSARMVELRIDRLLEKELLVFEGGRFCVTEKGRRLAHAFIWLQKLSGRR